jgi:hypothetical protein
MSLEMAHKVIVPPKKNYIPQFLKQRDINSYKRRVILFAVLPCVKPHSALFAKLSQLLCGVRVYEHIFKYLIP